MIKKLCLAGYDLTFIEESSKSSTNNNVCVIQKRVRGFSTESFQHFLYSNICSSKCYNFDQVCSILVI